MGELKLIDSHGYIMTKKYPESRMMMATTAHHKLGDISNKIPSLCVILVEYTNPYTREDFYVGCWDRGHCINIQFPKATTRDLTQKERVKLEKNH